MIQSINSPDTNNYFNVLQVYTTRPVLTQTTIHYVLQVYYARPVLTQTTIHCTTSIHNTHKTSPDTNCQSQYYL